MKILRSLEEFLYELLSWLVFYPRTLWRILRGPAGVSRYTRMQLEQPPGEQFLEMVSPVLTLILSVLVAHAIEMAARVPLATDELAPLANTLYGNYQGLLLSRGVVFGLYSLVAAVWIMSRMRTAIDRDTLREPFFIQAYLVSPFALVVSTASVMVRMAGEKAQLAGVALAVAITVWYLWAQTTTYRTLLGIGTGRALAYALVSFVAVTVAVAAAATVLFTA
ncbi:MAG: hypothetical protein ABWZ08_11095 [Pseudoxanthomonas sp.]